MVPFFSKKSLIFENFSLNFSQKTRIKQLINFLLSLEMTSVTVQLTILTFFSKIDENMVKNTENVNKISNYSQNFKSR